MTRLESLIKEVVEGREVSYTDSAALSLQPVSYSELKAVDEFCEQSGATGCLLPDFCSSFVLVKGKAVSGASL